MTKMLYAQKEDKTYYQEDCLLFLHYDNELVIDFYIVPDGQIFIHYIQGNAQRHDYIIGVDRLLEWLEKSTALTPYLKWEEGIINV